MLPVPHCRIRRPERLSILIRHEGGCYQSLIAEFGDLNVFQSSSATKADATRAEGGEPCTHQSFQSSSATKADATRQPDHRGGSPGLSILIRHEGGCYASTQAQVMARIAFQSSSATKADATLPRRLCPPRCPSFNPHPPRRRMLRDDRSRRQDRRDLSILIRHEGGCYRRCVD